MAEFMDSKEIKERNVTNINNEDNSTIVFICIDNECGARDPLASEKFGETGRDSRGKWQYEREDSWRSRQSTNCKYLYILVPI